MVARGASQWPVGSKRHTLYTWLDSRVFSVAIVFFTFEALFAADLLQVMLPKDFDIPVAVVTFAGFLLFMLEIVANFWVHRDYGARKGCDKLTVFLFIDLAGTLSLIPDFLILFGVSFSGSKSASLARAGRAARIGARMARLVRMFRLDEEEVLYGPDGRKLEVKSSTIGATVADKISTRVVLLVMALIIVLPVITYADPPTMEETAIDLFAALAADSAPSKPTAQTMAEFIEWYNTCSFDRCDRLEEIVYMRDMIGGATVNLQTNPLTGEFEKKAYDDYRDSEMRSFAYTICSDGSTMSETFEYSRDASDARAPECNSGTPTQRFAVTFQIKALLHEQSVMSLCFMAVAVAIFAIGAGGFLADVQKFVIAPVERISALTSNLSDTLAFLAPNAGSVKSQTGQGGGDGTAAAGGGEDEDEDEVKRLGDQVQKMLELLQIGFGEAGSKIIEQNLSKGTEELQPMMPGQYVDEIFVGFIMLENFDAVTDVMEADIMLYANYIGEFVHNCVVQTGGNPNKNMGGAILCVWKGANGASGGFKSFVKAIEGVDSDPKVRELCDRYNDKLIHYDGGRLSHGGRYRAELAAGLHCGWAIEGAVGSALKIDATYLSPNVNMAARMETATSQFGVHLIVSGEYYQRLAPETKRRCRHLDTCFVKGSVQPLPFWSPTIGEDEGNADIEFINQHTVDYNRAVERYLAGEWPQAAKELERLSHSFPEDQAPRTILDYMCVPYQKHKQVPRLTMLVMLVACAGHCVRWWDRYKKSALARGPPSAPSWWQNARKLESK